MEIAEVEEVEKEAVDTNKDGRHFRHISKANTTSIMGNKTTSSTTKIPNNKWDIKEMADVIP
eukprot:CAMPEP_0194341722 /NCGR_PEP_ID=MMETSP0171-20130528/90575_1 /TAXON_ID=218684 /ORGANISM="Corethron pennatum, Strain L29A3" /LENGTH=61 /DNA_ID=CAMNT_0039107169 /DNA_START=183 /DNA_END=368 /DNA_ORIENTATION=-